MKKAAPSELATEAVAVLEAGLAYDDLERLIPVGLEPLDPLAEAEPSVGALLRLDTGLLTVAIYGLETETLSLKVPESEVTRRSVRDLLEEIPVPTGSVRWRHPDTVDAPATAAPA